MARPFLPDHVFWNNVAISAFDEACWPWKGRTDENGRGRCRFRRASDVLAYRAAYELEYGVIPDGMFVLHKCDWPLCCNPFHLFLGTQFHNMRDMKQKGRGVNPVLHGEDHGRCIISDADIARMRRRYAEGHITHAELAQMFNVSPTQTGRILRGESRGLEPLIQPKKRSGKLQPASKLTDAQVAEIRAIGVSDISYRELGERYGVSHTQIRNILSGKSRNAAINDTRSVPLFARLLVGESC